MSRLDREAQRILQAAINSLREEMPDLDVCDADIDDGIYASDKHDRGAITGVTLSTGEHADIRLEIHSSVGYEGTLEGWAFGFACTYEGGEIGPGGTLGNYTADVWTKDREDIAARLRVLESHAPIYGMELAEAFEKRQNS